MQPLTFADHPSAELMEDEAVPLELPMCLKGHSYRATIGTCNDGWTVELVDEDGKTVPASGDFAATLLELHG